jgi:putative ABC transport system permease protein
MIRHLLRLAWNRKRSHVLILGEMFATFLVLFAGVTLALWLHGNWTRPLGFAWPDIWSITFNDGQGQDLPGSVTTHSDTSGAAAPAGGETPAAAANPAVERGARLALLVRRLRDFPEVDSVSLTSVGPWTFSTSVWNIDSKGLTLRTQVSDASDDFARVFQLELVRGRWFEPADAAQAQDPVVLNEKLAREAFGDADPIGRVFGPPDAARTMRVVGVVSDYRKDGELAAPDNFCFMRLGRRAAAIGEDEAPAEPGTDSEAAAWARARVIHVRLRPGAAAAGAALEERLLRALQGVAPTWSFDVRPLSELRATYLRLATAPLMTVGIVSVFLLLMVALGLVGVLWQDITRRTSEIGVRRALGATPGRVYGEILGELLLTTSFAIALAAALIAQFPLLDLIAAVRPGTYLAAFLVAAALMYGMTALAGLYPSRLAARVEPARALRDE